MIRKIGFLSTLLLLTILTGTAFAQVAGPQHTEATWQTTYWNNMTLSGEPAFQGNDANIVFDWGTGSPNSDVAKDHFSARWTRYVDLSAGTYRFTATSDDGIRLFVDGNLIINEWNDHSARTVTMDVSLNSGHHQITVEYYENSGQAVAKVSWQKTPTQIINWRGDYYANKDLAGSPILIRDDSAVNFNWGYGSPAPGIPNDRFSVRWTKTLYFETGKYRFSATTDDGIRLYINGDLVINQWSDHPATTYSTEVSLAAGAIEIEVEYYENTGLASAQLTWVQVPSNFEAWRGEYYPNMSLTGSPALLRDDESINFDWGWNSPATNIPSDHFSVRWIRSAYFEADTYRFSATSDDGIRVYLDGNVIINAWYDQAARTYTADIELSSGSHTIIVEYYENTKVASVKVNWSVAPQTILNWRGEYFNNAYLNGRPALVRDDESISFNWGYGSPHYTIQNDFFSVRWTRTLNLPAGTYRFHTTTDDGVRLWVNDHLLIDQWQEQAVTGYSTELYVNGTISVKMEYYEQQGLASARLMWSLVDGDPVSTPGTDVVIVDDGDPGFVRGGSVSGWQTSTDGYNGRAFWTWNNDRTKPGYNWANWYPNLNAGRYEVYVYVPDTYSTTGNARYWISHFDGFTVKPIDQSASGGQWVPLGTYRFRGTSSDYVSVADVTFEPDHSRLIAIDAVRFEPR